MSVSQLIVGCTRQDRSAQREVYALLSPKMFVVCLRYSRTREEAEESLQEGFLKVFTNIDQLKSVSSFEGWVRKIMVNCALQKFRSKPVLYAIPHTNIDNTEFISNEDITSLLGAKELIGLIQKLSPAYKMVFNLYVFEGLKHAEIAELLGISESTSKSNLWDARKILKKLIAVNVSTAIPNINYL